MATMEGARGAKTTLKFGLVEADVQLYGTVAKAADTIKFDTAGPNGKPLRYEAKAEAAPEEETPKGQPLAVKSGAPPEDPGPERSLAETVEKAEEAAAVGRKLMESTEPGQYRQVLREEGTGVWVEKEDVRRGIRKVDGEFVDLTEQLADIEERTQLDRMEVVATIDVGQVPRERVTGSYYLAANGDGAPRVLRLLFEALKATRRAAVVKWTKKTRQACGVIAVHGKTGALIVLEVAWAEDVREPNARVLAHQQAEVYEQEVDVACELVDELKDTRAALDELRDDALRLREELVLSVEAGEQDDFELPPLPVVEPEESIEDLLRRSIEEAPAIAASA